MSVFCPLIASINQALFIYLNPEFILILNFAQKNIIFYAS